MHTIRLLKRVIYNIWGSVQNPYVTYRELVTQDPLQLVVLFAAISGYFVLVSPLKFHTFHPFLLTLNIARLLTAVIFTYLAICCLFYVLGLMLKTGVKLRSILMGWGYSLVPTLLWFFTTSFFYVILPPPRHETILGRLFSLLYITFSVSLFFWKGILYYLTLRFALKLDFLKISLVSIIFFPLLGIYSYIMYVLSVFRVPFV